jgi:hypothetical protein
MIGDHVTERRMPLNFGLTYRSHLDDQTFIRCRPDVAGFILYRNREHLHTVGRLLIHVDFPGAERDTAAGNTGTLARGTGVLEFSGNRPPVIVSRDLARATSVKNIGFSLDVASPYPLLELDLPGLQAHVLASSFEVIREAFNDAYNQYVQATKNNYCGIPVFDTCGWQTFKPESGPAMTHKTYRPVMKLCGFTSGLNEPLTLDEVVSTNELRREEMRRNKLDRPRMGAPWEPEYGV